MRDNFEMKMKKPIIIGHRGFRAKYPENTLVSFDAAIRAGVDMIELDVRLSKDNHLIVIHDEKLDRTTNGHGFVKDFTLPELKQLDAGSWFDSAFRNEKMPRLEEVFDFIKGKSLINIEIKPEKDKGNGIVRILAEKTAQTIKKYKAKEFSLVSSFSRPILENIIEIDRDLAVGVLTEWHEEGDFLSLCKSFKAFSWHPYYKSFNKKDILKMHKAGIKVIPYTVNSEDEIAELIKMGIDGLFTDDPLTALKARDLSY